MSHQAQEVASAAAVETAHSIAHDESQESRTEREINNLLAKGTHTTGSGEDATSNGQTSGTGKIEEAGAIQNTRSDNATNSSQATIAQNVTKHLVQESNEGSTSASNTRHTYATSPVASGNTSPVGDRIQGMHSNKPTTDDTVTVNGGSRARSNSTEIAGNAIESSNRGDTSPGGSKKPTTPPGWRVKLYQLCDSGKWADKGTGYVRCIYLESVNSSAIQVISEGDQNVGKVLLESQVMNDDIYRRQGETIITWNESVANHDLALSFQESEGCQTIWEQLCQVQGRLSSDYHEELSTNTYPANGTARQSEGDDGFEASTTMSDGTLSHEHIARELPFPSIANLEEIQMTLSNAISINEKSVREHCADAVLSACETPTKPADGSDPKEQNETKTEECNSDESKNETVGKDAVGSSNGQVIDTDSTWLARLLSLFSVLEDMENVRALHLLFNIVKLVALLHDSQVYETMLDDRYFETVVGILEYDPEIPIRPKHREFLSKQVVHRQVVPITDADILHKIHQNFRIGFLRDVLLPRSLDEPSFTTLSQMDLLNAVDIATGLHNDTAFMSQLFARLRNPPKDVKRESIIEFLHELCSLAKKLQVHARNAFYRSLLERDKFFDIFEGILGDPESSARERVLVTDILMLSLQHESSLLRTYIMEEGKHPNPVPVQLQSTSKIENPSVSCSNQNKPEMDKHRDNSSNEHQSPNGNQQSEAWPVAQSGSLLFRLIERMVYDPEPGMQAQASEVIRFLLNPETMEVNEKDKFLTLFYEHYIGWLVTPLNRSRKARTPVQTKSSASSSRRRLADCFVPNKNRVSQPENSDIKDTNTNEPPSHKSTVVVEDYSLNFVRGSELDCELDSNKKRCEQEETMRVAEHHLCELLSFCVQTHGYRIKYYILRNDVVGCVLKLLHCREKHLVLDAIRFIRTCVGIKDNFYNRFFVRNNSFKGIFSIFKINGPRNNLINSAIIELLEFVRTENIKCLVEHIVNEFAHVFKEVNYVDTYRHLLQQHKENVEFRRNPILPNPQATDSSSSVGSASSSTHLSSQVRGQQPRTSHSAFGERVQTDQQEESFFNSDDDEGMGPSVPPAEMELSVVAQQDKQTTVKRSHPEVQLREIGSVGLNKAPQSQDVRLVAKSEPDSNGGGVFKVQNTSASSVSAISEQDQSQQCVELNESPVKKTRSS